MLLLKHRSQQRNPQLTLLGSRRTAPVCPQPGLSACDAHTSGSMPPPETKAAARQRRQREMHEFLDDNADELQRLQALGTSITKAVVTIDKVKVSAITIPNLEACLKTKHPTEKGCFETFLYPSVILSRVLLLCEAPFPAPPKLHFVMEDRLCETFATDRMRVR